MANQVEATETLVSLVTAEQTALHTYENVLKKADSSRGAEQLHRIESDHKQALASLREFQATHPEPRARQEHRGWNNLEFIAESSSDPLTDPVSVKALKVGEEQIVLRYESALKANDVSETLRELINSRLLPAAREHVAVLDKILYAA